MKRNVKHKFTHGDPEIKIKKNPDQKTSSVPSDDFKLIKKDLLRTSLAIAIFVIAIVLIFIIKEKTDWFTILLSKIKF
jgi:hypothetical protein